MIKELESVSVEVVKNKINEIINSVNELKDKELYTGLVFRRSIREDKVFKRHIYYVNNGVILNDDGYALPIFITSLEALVASTGVVFEPIKQIQETISFDNKNKEYNGFCCFIDNATEKGFTNNKIYKEYINRELEDSFLINDFGEEVYNWYSELPKRGVFDFIEASDIGKELKGKEDYFKKLLKE